MSKAADDLHWKKELTTLRKAARLLRDPETTSSLRSPLTSRSLASNYLFTAPPTARSPFKPSHPHKQVFLYNWRHAPAAAKSTDDSGDNNKLEANPHSRYAATSPSASASGDSSNNEHSKPDPIVLFRLRDAHDDTLPNKSIKKSKRPSVARRVARRPLTASKLLDPPHTSSGRPIASVDQSDDTEYCNSEDLRISTRDLMRKSGYTSKPPSPALSNKGNWSSSSKLLTKLQREDSSVSYTPASTRSFSRYRRDSNNTVESWDDISLNGDDDAQQLDLSRRQGCGIPCYWSKRTPKHRSLGSYSPSLSDTLRRKGSSMLCGSQTLHKKRRSSRCNKQKFVAKSAQGLPLLSNSFDGGGRSSKDSAESDDDLSTNCGELDLEALSRLDGRIWSLSCGSHEGLELVAPIDTDQGTSDHVKSLSRKYSPRFFDEIIGQNIVAQSLANAISRERIAPAYLFQGPRGTGKTSTARIFSAALNCVATEEIKPCGSCRECTNFRTEKNMELREVDATNKQGIDRIMYILESLSMAPSSYFSHYKVFIIDQCHLLPTKTWLDFMKFLEEPPTHVVFIFITTDLDNLPRTVLSRCQKYIFNKIRDADIVTRLKKLSEAENLDVELHALHLIALNADGSLRDAETMLEQLSLLGKKITTSLVNELVGVVPDEKLLDLLELAMSSDTAETVKRSRELMDSGVDPMALMSQLAGLIMDIIAGTYQLVDSKCSGSIFSGRSLTEAELERLKQSLKLLLEAEKQLRFSSERSTWFTAALLQLGSASSPDPTCSSSSRKLSSKTSEDGPSNTSLGLYANKKKLDAHHMLRTSTSSSISSPQTMDRNTRGHPLPSVDNTNCDTRPQSSRVVERFTSLSPQKDIIMAERKVLRCINPEKLDEIWIKCIERCHSKTLRQLLLAHGRLLSISEVEGVLIASVALESGDIKSRAERFLSSITNSLETVLRRNVDVELRLISDSESSIDRTRPGLPEKMEATGREMKGNFSNSKIDHSDFKPCHELQKDSRKGFNDAETNVARGTPDQSAYSVPGEDGCYEITTMMPGSLEVGNNGKTKERKQDPPMQRIQTIIDEQRLESAWLQATEKGTPTSLNRLKPEKNQILPQDGVSGQNKIASMILAGASSQKWEDELNREIKVLKINDIRCRQREQTGQRFDHSSMSPSLLHNGGSLINFKKDSNGYESASSAGGCGGLLCWKTSKGSRNGKVKPGTPIRLRKKQFSCFGQCGKKTK